MKDILAVLPPRVAIEIEGLSRSYADFYGSLSEIRLRTPGACAVVLGGKNLLLSARVGEKEIEETVGKLCHGSLYAYRDAIAEGYLPFSDGIRVGVVGTARYERGTLFGISEIRGLTFRIPHEKCDTLPALLSLFETAKAGMLLFSPPGVGKTTALKALSKAIGSGKTPKRVAVIDERFEFPPSCFSGTTVDVLSGYRREKGLEIAVRTLSPEVIVLDEIGGEDEARGLLALCKSGVPLLASAHADSINEVRSKPSLLPFTKLGVFDVCAGIRRTDGAYSLSYAGVL